MILNRKKLDIKSSICEVLIALIYTFRALYSHPPKYKARTLIKTGSSLVSLLRMNWFTNVFTDNLLLQTSCIIWDLRKSVCSAYQSKSEQATWLLYVTGNLYMEEVCESGYSQSCWQSHSKIQWQKVKLDKFIFEIKGKFLTGLWGAIR